MSIARTFCIAIDFSKSWSDGYAMFWISVELWKSTVCVSKTRLNSCIKKKNQIFISIYSTRGITPKRVTSDEAHFRGLAPGQHSSEETWQRWRSVSDTVSDLTDPEFEPILPAPIVMF